MFLLENSIYNFPRGEKVKAKYCRRRETAGRVLTEGLELTYSHEHTKTRINYLQSLKKTGT